MKVDEMIKLDYKPAKNNDLDQYLSKFLAKYPSLIVVKKLQYNWYSFNDKTKVYIKLTNNNKLVVRVGGGFGSLKEYMDQNLKHLLANYKPEIFCELPLNEEPILLPEEPFQNDSSLIISSDIPCPPPLKKDSLVLP